MGVKTEEQHKFTELLSELRQLYDCTPKRLGCGFAGIMLLLVAFGVVVYWASWWTSARDLMDQGSIALIKENAVR